jgi:hypothetical protein
VAQLAIGGEADLSNTTAGSTTTGLSQCTLSNSVAGSGTAQMRIIDIAPYPDNAWGDSFVIVRATIAEYQFAGAAGTSI